LVKHMAERIRKITLDILFYAKERELNPSCGALRQLVADVTRTVAPRFDRRGIRLICDLEGAAGNVELDFGLLKAVLINLLENAVDACLADGRRKSDYRVTLKAECNAEAVGLSVEDNGVGDRPAARRRHGGGIEPRPGIPLLHPPSGLRRGILAAGRGNAAGGRMIRPSRPASHARRPPWRPVS
nr:hypothetical protein [Desulfobacterales bacterium]